MAIDREKLPELVQQVIALYESKTGQMVSDETVEVVAEAAENDMAVDELNFLVQQVQSGVSLGTGQARRRSRA